MLSTGNQAQLVSFDWAISTGGIGTKTGESMATNASGNVYTTGQFYDITDFDPGPGVFNLTPVRSE